MEVCHACRWKGRGELHLSVRIIGTLLAIELPFRCERAVHVAHWDTQDLQTEGDRGIATHMGHDGCQMTTSGGSADSEPIQIEIELFGFVGANLKSCRRDQ